MAVAVAAAALARGEEAVRVQTGVSQAASASRGSCRPTTSSTEIRTQPAPAASARPSAPPRGSYRPQCAGPDARVTLRRQRPRARPERGRCPEPSGDPAEPVPSELRGAGLVVLSVRTVTQAPGHTLALTPGQRGQTEPAKPGHHLSPFPWPPQAHPPVRTTLRSHQGKREDWSCTGQELGQSAARVGRQAINLHMEIKLQIWENIQEII
ncbi:translation initiation factor IF-2-like [Vidua macroura]|uniref:translation initiation factor IF-2-like n=1 Tax=Vidua macroura TaxID=187451 RepID=UPI0023A88BFE|nr:translation initiation factor IF-2-like [Vidua macroura]